MQMLLALALLVACTDPPPQRVACGGQPPAIPFAVAPARLLADVAALADDSMQGRALGTEGGARARRWLERRVRPLGLDTLGPLVQPFTVPMGRDSVRGANLVAYVPGTKATAPWIVVTAHYDHVGVRNGETYNGADDNASGTAALVAIAEHFRAHPPEHPVLVAWLDGEERGLRGATAFVQAPPVPLERVAVAVNLDMVGRSVRKELFVTGPAHRPWLTEYVRRAACGTTAALMLGHDKGASGSQDWTYQSDHGVFHERGVPFLYLGVEDHPDYHRPTDDVERIDPAFLASTTRAAIALVTALDRDLEAVARKR